LPPGAAPIQVEGRNYYHRGEVFYVYHPRGYYLVVKPPHNWRRYHRPGRPHYQARYRAQREASCRRFAAERARRHAHHGGHGGRIYQREYMRCIRSY
jgi:hypothetical protein